MANFVFELSVHRRTAASREQSATETSDAITRRLLRGEDQQFNGTFRHEAGSFERANRFQTTQDTDCTVEAPSIRYCIDVGACSDGTLARTLSTPASKGIADCILANYQPCIGAKFLKVIAGTNVGC